MRPDAFISYQDPRLPSALSAETVDIIAHNKGLQAETDMMLLPSGEREERNTIILQVCRSCFFFGGGGYQEQDKSSGPRTALDQEN